MIYSNLHKILLGLESQVPAIPPTQGLGWAGLVVNQPGLKTPVQAFGLDKSTCERDLPVVVALGINYTQDPVPCPRDPAGVPAVEDNLSSCRQLMMKARTAHGDCAARWHQTGNASSAHLALPEKFHFVMTNFCLWITTEPWLELPVADRAGLLANNPPFAGAPTATPSWPHLAALAQALAMHTEPALWVVHGLHSEVFGLFNACQPILGLSPWLRIPNLGYPYSHYCRSFPRPIPFQGPGATNGVASSASSSSRSN